MLVVFVFAVLGGMAGLVAYEIVDEVRSSSHRLQDRYHE